MSSLNVTNAQIIYDGSIEAVRDVSLTVGAGHVVCMLGANGSGKTTLLKAISAVLFPEKGVLTNGTISYGEMNLSGASSDEIVRSGIVQVPEGRRMFASLTLEENLVMGGYTLEVGERASRLQHVYEVFPDLTAHRGRMAGYLSGGQQQMVAIGRALMAKPSLLMLDEPSLGLAPKIVEQIFGVIDRLRSEHNISILLVEQNAKLALQVSDHGYVLERGRVAFDGASDALLKSSEIQEFYMGVGASNKRHSMREVKHYKRRKRWLS